MQWDVLSLALQQKYDIRTFVARTADFEIDSLFLDRWSPRSMTGEVISIEILHRLFEAARWAPSSGNSQPWKFFYAQAKTPAFERFFSLLDDGNQPWCAKAGALLVVATQTVNSQGRPLRTAAFDAGAAWVSLAFQGSLLGLVVHGMAGFDYDRASIELAFPEGIEPCCMVAIGHRAPADELLERYRSREQPSLRNSQSSFVFEGGFPIAPTEKSSLLVFRGGSGVPSTHKVSPLRT